MLPGAKMLMDQTVESVPYAKELDYLDSDGSLTNYFDLEIRPDFSSTYEFETVVYDSDYQNKTICAALDISPQFVWFFVAQTFNGKLDLNYGVNGTDDAGSVAFVNGHRMRVRSLIGPGVQKGWIQDLTEGGQERLVTGTTYPAFAGYRFQANLRLFNRTNILAHAVRRMGRTTLKVDGRLMFDLVPCLTTEGDCTFYNRAAGVFATRVGTFTGGFYDGGDL